MYEAIVKYVILGLGCLKHEHSICAMSPLRKFSFLEGASIIYVKLRPIVAPMPEAFTKLKHYFHAINQHKFAGGHFTVKAIGSPFLAGPINSFYTFSILVC